jgi:O-antigen/teichoic acid export membrane protein
MKAFTLSIGTALIIRVLGAISAFVTSIVVARTLGPEQSGYYFLAFAVVAVLATFSRVGLDNTVVRFVGADTTQVRSVMKIALTIGGIGSSISATLLYIFAEPLAQHVFFKPDLTAVFQSMSIGVIGLALLTLVGSMLQGLGRVVPSVLLTGVILNLSLMVALLFLSPATAASTARLFGGLSLVTALIGFLLFCRYRPIAVGVGIHFRIVLQSCVPLWLFIMMQQVLQWSGQFIAGVYLGSEEVAFLAAAQRTAMLVSFVLVAVNLVVAPKFAELHQKGKLQELEELALYSVKMIVLFGLPVIVLLVSVPDKIMLLFGVEFSVAGPLLRILAVGQFFNAICGPVGTLLIMTGNERDVRDASLIAGVFAITVIWALTLYFGASGNAIGTALAVAGQNFLIVYYVRKRLGFNTLSYKW